MGNENRSLGTTSTRSWRTEFAWMMALAAMGVAASYLSINIPYTPVYIEGRWIFGYIGFAILSHRWMALLLAAILSVAGPHKISLGFALIGNMLYALPTMVTIRSIHKWILNRLHAPVWYGLAWLLLILGCYQAFTTPAVWGFMAFLGDDSIGAGMLEGWRMQPFLLESVAVGIVSALAMISIRSHSALRESQQELCITLYSIGDGVISTDAAGRIRRMNPAAERLSGWREAEAIGKPLEAVFTLLDEDTRAPIENLTQRLLASGHILDLTQRALLASRDGSEYAIADSAAPIRDENQHMTGIVLTFRDQSKERAVQRTQQETYDRLLLALRNARMGIWEWSIRSSRASYFGEYENLFGMPVEAFGNTVPDIRQNIHPDDQARTAQAFQHAVRTGADFNETYRIIWPDGGIHWIHTHGKPVFDERGNLQRIVGTIQDVTERRQVEAERARLNAQIHEQARQTEQILMAVPAGILLLDAEGRILQSNQTDREVLPVLEGLSVGDFLTQLGDRPLADLLTTPPTRGLWHEVQLGKYTFEAITRQVGRGSEPGYWVLVIKDVTLEREIQAQLQQQERLAAVGQLAAGIAHDFNNIMAVITLYIQLTLRATGLSPKEIERLSIISQQVQRASALIQQILDFSRRAVLERQLLDLKPFLKELLKLLRRTMPENIRIELISNVDGYIVNADPTRLQQAIMNLVFNARDAMPDGGELTFNLSRGVADDTLKHVAGGAAVNGEWVRLAVTDSGTGIAPDALPHIFEPFFTTKEIGKGTGLGLAQVYGIVNHHEGYIDVHTQVGVGTTFTLYLPASPAPTMPKLVAEMTSLARGQGETILVVEDDETLRRALVESLELLRYQTLEAGNGQAALEILAHYAPGASTAPGQAVALVLSDLVMPKMGGQALFYAMRQRGLNLPVIVLSGHPMETELEQLLAQGLAGWLSKPPDVARLSQLLDRVLHPRPDTTSDDPGV